MRALLFAMLLLPCVARAQDAQRFERALRGPQAMDRWMKKEIHRQRKGQVITTPSTSYVVHRATFDGLVAFLQRQPGVENAAWDRCTNKIMLWPGHSTIGVRVMLDGAVHERCYRVQEGIPGTLRLPGCDGGGETTVLAHIRGTWTGIGTKPSDSFAIYACHSCHGWEEKGGVSLDGDRLRALYETQQIMLREGLLTMAGRR